jgi:tellurite methyltransferase
MFDEKYPDVDPNKKTSQEIWNARYGSTSGYLFGKEPVSLLKTHANVLKKGRTLDIAIGEGRNAVYLASLGFDVEGTDGCAVAIERANELAKEKNVSISAKTQNLDFFLMPLMKYDTIVMAYFRPQARFFSEVRRGLVNGGTFAFESYTTEHYKSLGPTNPNLDFEECYKPNEVLGHLKDFRVLYYSELPQGSSHTVQLIAKKQS